MKKYDHKKIEQKWQKVWARKKIYKTPDKSADPKCYVLDMFPYPSGEGLHVGHPKGYIATDVYSRFKRMNGFNVLHPMGWDAFGLPAENFAIKNKIHPRKSVVVNIKRYKEQLSIIGLDYDWSREINTTDTEYYKWTQWIFLQMFKKGLAYESHEPINWCPSCQTGLANEDLEDGRCERCSSLVEKRPMRQWVLKITDYAERLLADLKDLNWPEHIKESQTNWIGKSQGSAIAFALTRTNAEHTRMDAEIEVFTTRVDTIFGATYLVVAPEHLLVSELLAKKNHESEIANQEEIRNYIRDTMDKTEIERTAVKKDKTGVLIKGIKAINPATKEEIPIWVADYVLPTYGTGAIMAVPAHDERDFQFAKKYKMSIRQVIEPLFVQEKEPGLVREREPIVPRDGIIAIIKHWSEDTYVCLKWKKVSWMTLLTGGIEKDQNISEAALAEILEETGFKNAKFIKELGIVHGLFYHVPKKENRLVHGHIVYFELQNGERQEISEKENEIHEITWLSLDELKKHLTATTHLYSIDLFRNKMVVFTGNGTLMNSGEFSGMSTEDAARKITEKFGKKITKYKLRDWIFSRQRYWGEPIPLIHCGKCGVVTVPEKDLPVKLPEVKHYKPTGTGESPLANISKWVNVQCPVCKGKAKRETNTMPQWAGSCWYYLRYMDTKNRRVLVDPKKEKYWAPVDMYVGGAEHATRHLIYARFWHKFLYDIGVVSTAEPFSRLKNVGLILAPDGKKMSKRYGNVINPDDIVATYGADTFRVYEMFMGPFDQSVTWNTKSIIGPRRFLEKIWKQADKFKVPSRLAESRLKVEPDSAIEMLLHRTIKKVTEDIENFNFNTAISSLMILANEFENAKKISGVDYQIFLRLLAPFAPHITEEIWRKLGKKKSIHLEDWPVFDAAKITAKNIAIVVQINGKVRTQIEVDERTTEDEIKKKTFSNPIIKKWLHGKEIRKLIYVKGRLINIVV